MVRVCHRLFSRLFDVGSSIYSGIVCSVQQVQQLDRHLVAVELAFAVVGTPISSKLVYHRSVCLCEWDRVPESSLANRYLVLKVILSTMLRAGNDSPEHHSWSSRVDAAKGTLANVALDIRLSC